MKNVRYLSISIAILILDQTTKYAVVHSRVIERPIVVVPGFFRLAFGENSGALFGMFASLGQPWRTLVLMIVPLMAIVLVLVFMRMSEARDRLALIGLSSILGGAMGNQLDRLVRPSGSVVDFLDFYIEAEPVRGWLVRTFGSFHWYVFNVADTSIVVGALILAYDLLRQTKPHAH